MKSRVKFGVITLYYLWESWHICHSSGNFVTVHDFQLLLRNENRYNIGTVFITLKTATSRSWAWVGMYHTCYFGAGAMQSVDDVRSTAVDHIFQ